MHLHLHRSGYHRLLLRSENIRRERDRPDHLIHVNVLPLIVHQCLERCIGWLHEGNMDAISTRELLEEGLCGGKVSVPIFVMQNYTETATHLATGIFSLNSCSYCRNMTKGGRS